MTDVRAVTERIERESAFLRDVTREVEGVIVGQKPLIDSLLIGLLADGHVLLEGLPGLGKSLAVESVAAAFGGIYRRIQFTPDLLPSDLLGTQVYSPKTGEWSVREGPVFGNFVLADEINRAPAKVQSALLEAMQERQVTLAGETHSLPGALPGASRRRIRSSWKGPTRCPEAQIDRFMLKIVVRYPTREGRRAARSSASMATRRPAHPPRCRPSPRPSR